MGDGEKPGQRTFATAGLLNLPALSVLAFFFLLPAAISL
jgi:hypothetical protein